MLRHTLLPLFCLASLAAAQSPIALTPDTLPTLREQLRAARKADPTTALTITFADGLYEVAAPLSLEAQDSNITLRAAEGAHPTLIGARQVSGFAPHTGHIVKADITALMSNGLKPRQLLCDGQRLPLARWPNVDASDPLYGGWAYVDDIPPSKIEGHAWKSAMYLKPQDLRTWAHPEEVELNIFAMYGWWNFIQPVKALDTTSRLLTLATPCGYDLHPHNRFILQNALEELDAPGEWYIDPRTHTLYLWPTGPIAQQDIRLVTLETFIKVLPGAQQITISGLTFTGCNGTAAQLDKTQHCTIADCTFTQAGGFNGTAISINGGNHNAARSNRISQIGSSGISLSGGDRKTLTNCDNLADNNHIHHIGVFNKNACGIGITGCGITASHNLIHDGPRMGIQFSGNNIILEYNHIHHVVLETQDGGAIYTGGRDWISSRGSIWRYNMIHDVIGCGQETDGLHHPWFTFGLYPDDNTGGIDIIGNIVFRCPTSALHMHNSRDCIVENNIFAQCGKYQFDLHGWHTSQNFYKSHIATMIAGWDSVKDQPAWKTLRGMDIDPRQAAHPDGTMMQGDRVQRNIIYTTLPGSDYANLRYCDPEWNTIDNNLAWAGGSPLRTGYSKVGKNLGPDLYAGGLGSFDQAAPGKTPKGWGLINNPRKGLQLIVIDQALSIEGAHSDDPKNAHTACQSAPVPMQPGKSFRATMRVRCDIPERAASIAFMSYQPGKYWGSQGKRIALTTDWQTLEITVRLPAPGEPAYKPELTDFRLRFDFDSPDGHLFVDDLTLHQADPLSDWAAWQDAGWDKNSLIADPLFVDAEHDDYRLKPESPALLKLGFKPIPVSQIGLRK
jgi:hypothetical protein